MLRYATSYGVSAILLIGLGISRRLSQTNNRQTVSLLRGGRIFIETSRSRPIIATFPSSKIDPKIISVSNANSRAVFINTESIRDIPAESKTHTKKPRCLLKYNLLLLAFDFIRLLKDKNFLVETLNFSLKNSGALNL